MSLKHEAPEGFESLVGAEGTLFARRDLLQPLLDLQLDAPGGWRKLLSSAPAASGRGAVARVRLPGGERLLLKKLLRGGLAGRLRKELFAGAGRLLDNLRLPIEAQRRGVPTAAPAALLLAPGPGRMFHGWLAVDEIADADDLSALYSAGSRPSRKEMGAAIGLVRRMHEAGLVHRDLNLGNLLVRGGAGRCDAFVIDLDGASFSEGPLPFGRRRAALRRLERSYVKQAMLSGRRPIQAERDRIYELYAAGASALAEKLRRGRALGNFQIFLHRLWWVISG
jgi:hypothetical protein